jgi:hypothetical protein
MWNTSSVIPKGSLPIKAVAAASVTVSGQFYRRRGFLSDRGRNNRQAGKAPASVRSGGGDGSNGGGGRGSGGRGRGGRGGGSNRIYSGHNSQRGEE